MSLDVPGVRCENLMTWHRHSDELSKLERARVCSERHKERLSSPLVGFASATNYTDVDLGISF